MNSGQNNTAGDTDVESLIEEHARHIESALGPEETAQVRGAMAGVFETLSRIPGVQFASDIASYAKYAPGTFAGLTLGGTPLATGIGAGLGVLGGLVIDFLHAQATGNTTAPSGYYSGDDKRSIQPRAEITMEDRMNSGAIGGGVGAGVLYLLVLAYQFQKHRQNLMAKVEMDRARRAQQTDVQGQGINEPNSQEMDTGIHQNSAVRSETNGSPETENIPESLAQTSQVHLEVVTNLSKFAGGQVRLGDQSPDGMWVVYKPSKHKDVMPPVSQQVLISKENLIKSSNNEALKSGKTPLTKNLNLQVSSNGLIPGGVEKERTERPRSR